MGRELKRKQAKREGKNVREVQKQNNEKPLSPRTLVVILASLLLFFVILYILTGLFVTKELKWFGNDKEEENITEVDNKILAADSLRQVEEDYYVYFYDTTKEDMEVSNILYSVSEKVYRVDLSSDFNANFVGEPSGVVEDINSLKVSNPTVIKVSSEKIVAFYNGSDEIEIALK